MRIWFKVNKNNKERFKKNNKCMMMTKRKNHTTMQMILCHKHLIKFSLKESQRSRSNLEFIQRLKMIIRMFTKRSNG